MIEAVITGEREVIARLTALPGAVRTNLLVVMRRLMVTLQAKAKGLLSGPVLKNQTGNLRQSIGQEVADDGDTIAGRAGIFGGPTLIYGRFWELGFHGTVNVAAHMREMKQAFGVPIAPRAVEVSAHTREVQVDPRSFLGAAFEQMRPEIEPALRVAVSTAVQGAT